MKKLLLISVLLGLLPLSMAAQVDDLYFVPKKKSATKVTDRENQSRDVYYSGSNRSIDEYNRRVGHFDLIAQDSTLNDTINFSAERGVFPDSTSTEDFELTRQMSRFDDYSIADNDAYWAGYAAGRYDWGWHSPWYYGGWYWNDPWFYSGYYGWYGSWYGYYPYYSWYGPRYGYHTYYYTAGGGRYYTGTGNAGTINLRGGSRVMKHGSGVARNGSGRLVGTNRGIERSDRLRNRTVGTSRTTTGNRSTATRNNTNFNGGSRMSSSSSSSGRSSYSGGGGVSRGSGGGGFSGGGGGGARGGRR